MKVWRYRSEQRQCSVDNVLDIILESKGLSYDDFINCECNISDPSDFYGMSGLVSRLNLAIEKFEKICIFGDYDCDGVTATVMLYSYLSKKNIDVMYMLPSRFEDGYGLTNNVIDKIKSYGVTLIITVDNGVSAYNEISYSNSVGIDVIVTDHHKIPEKLPPAVAIVNPHLNDSGFKDFAGVGVVFKIIQELEKNSLSLDDLIREYGDLLSIGTIGDMVPMVGENRYLVKKAFEHFSQTKRPGVQVLLEGSSFGDMDGSEISFGIAPKLNACGRIGSAETAAKLLLSSSISEARSFLKIALEMNESRKSLCNSIFEEVEKKIYEKKLYNNKIICAWSENWNHGVIGIAASVICNKFGKPCFLFSVQGEESRGSGRSISGFDICDHLSQCQDLLTKFGGHPMAAGANIKSENLEKFNEKFLNNAVDMPLYYIDIDCVIDPENISIDILNEINKLSPFGSENMEPIFAILSVTLVRVISIGSGRHIRITFKKNGKIFESTMFGVSLSDFLFSPGDIIDLAVRLKKNFFLGKESAVIHVVDVKLSEIDSLMFASDERIFENFILGIDPLPNDCIPTREDCIQVFNCIRNLSSFRIEKLYSLMKSKIRPAKIFLILEIFSELKIFNVTRNCENYRISVKSKEKVNLNESLILKKAILKTKN